MNDKLRKSITKFGPEWIILEQITKGDSNSILIIKEILAEYKLNWGEFIEQAMSHKIFPMTANFFIVNQLFEKVPPFINQYFRMALDVNIEKVRKIKEYTIKITQILLENNIEFVATKGIVLDNQIYENMGYRFLSDADFIVKSKYKAKVIELLKSIGFIIGTVDWKTNEVKELSRKEYLIYMSTPDKLPELVISTNDNIIKYISIGFVTSFTWDKCEYQVEIDEAFKYNTMLPIGIDNFKIPVLDNVYHYIYIILHLYKHAWVEYLSKWNNDVNLVKFGDVYRFFLLYEGEIVEKLPVIIKKHNIEKPVIWTMQHTDEIFGSNMVEKIGYKGFVSEDYLHQSGDKKGNIKRWKGNMRERLASKDRKSLYIS